MQTSEITAPRRRRPAQVDIPAGWRSMCDMPIGDHRYRVVEVRGGNGEGAVAYWTGQIWAYAPVGSAISALPFYPVMHRPLTTPSALQAEHPAAIAARQCAAAYVGQHAESLGLDPLSAANVVTAILTVRP